MNTEQLFDVRGKVAVVTGASSGLGHRFAQTLHASGAHVLIVARRADRLESLARELDAEDARVIPVAADVTDIEQARSIASRAQEEFGRVDVLVNNAGLGGAVPSSRESEDHFRQVLDVNLSAAFWLAQACQPLMEPGASIINISSVLAHTGSRFPQAAYTASKAGILGLTRNLAQEWSGRKGIRVNAICPGYFASEMTEVDDTQLRDMVATQSILGRFGEPEELDGALLFFASHASSFVTGTSLLVDGGMAAI